jgi:hypothetical protein
MEKSKWEIEGKRWFVKGVVSNLNKSVDLKALRVYLLKKCRNELKKEERSKAFEREFFALTLTDIDENIQEGLTVFILQYLKV